MTRTIAALIATASIAGAAAPAAAQTKYFARERIAGLAKTAAVTYVPTYSSTFGSCVGGSQSKAMTACTTSDNKPANLSDCSASPQSIEAKDCTMPVTCGTPMYGMFAMGYTKLELLTYVPNGPGWENTVRSRCNGATASYPKTTSCNAQLRTGNEWYVYLGEGGTVRTSANPGSNYASTCQ